MHKINWQFIFSWSLFICLSRYLDQEHAKWPFWSSSQAASCVITQKGQGHNKRTCRLLFLNGSCKYQQNLKRKL